jgi:membrane protein YqaA with SNARE-associated domain
VRRLYDWVLHWADTRYGVPALFGLSVAEASFFPIPPDPLLLALCLGAPKKAYRFATVVTVGSVTGGLIGYGIGALGWQAMETIFFTWVPGFSPAKFAAVKSLYDRWDFWAVFIAGLTPIPYKVFTISAGVFSIDLPVFVLASVASRGLRFFVIAALIRTFGKPIGRFIDRSFNLLMWLLGALVVGGCVVVRFLL